MKHQPGIPAAVVTPVRGQQISAGISMFASQSFAPAVEAQPIPSESVSFQTEKRRSQYVGTGQ